MQILFDTDLVSFHLLESPLAPIYRRILSHLRHLDIPFRLWDNRLYPNQDPVTKLISYGSKIGIEIDPILCYASDQNYLNFLHRVYEKSYDGNPKWLDFHDHIHLCEKSSGSIKHPRLYINWREKAGMLERTFDLDWLKTATTRVSAGDVYVEWAELGKTPYTYWLNKEPNDMDRIKELCKPWLKLKPKIVISLEDHDYATSSEEFELWWKLYHDEWCRHWQIPKWDLDDMCAKLVFGYMPDSERHRLHTLLSDGQSPRRLLP